MTKRSEEKAPSALNTPAADLASATPTVGRIVFYSPADSDVPREFAAVVTGVDEDGAVSLFVMHPDGACSSAHHIRHQAAAGPFGTWHWPPRV